MTDDYDATKDAHDSYYAAIEAKRLRGSSASNLSAETLRALLDYNPETGIFRWRGGHTRKCPAGSRAGRVDTHGYITIRLMGVARSAHRLAWLYVHGEWPRYQIDHINHTRTDNRIANLRDVTASENSRNRRYKSYYPQHGKGVTFIKRIDKWQSQITIPSKGTKYLGVYATEAEALAAYAGAARVSL